MLSAQDHRKHGQDLDLFHLQEDAPGSVFWHPRGLALVRALESHLRRVVVADGYEEVRSPQVMARPIWDASGHWEKFAGGMLRVAGARASALKPVNCPGHIQIAARRRPSHHDLPLRFAEMGLVHRNERKSQLLGLFRLRQFTQDDGHVFCSPEHVQREVVRFCARAASLYRELGIGEVRALISLRPKVRVGSDAEWDEAEAVLARAVAAAGLASEDVPGGGAFYAPKLELVVADASGRPWQCGTIQVDYFMAQRFGLRFVDRDGRDQPLVMVHRALVGSLERFVGILLEHHDGRVPPWLAPESVRILPVAEGHRAYARELEGALARQGVRVGVDALDAPLGKRIFRAHESKVPLVAVVGARDVAQRSVALRGVGRGEGESAVPFDDAVALLAARAAPPEVTALDAT